MTNSITPSRAVAVAAAVLSACLLACALQGVLASPAGAFTPAHSKAPGGENTPLNLNSTSASGSKSSDSSSGGASIVRTIVGLAIVIAVIWGLAWILRQVKKGRDPNVSSAGLTAVAALTLSSGRSVHLVRAGHDYLLLGSAEHGVVPIHRYTEDEARDAGLLVAQMPRERSRIIAAAGGMLGPPAERRAIVEDARPDPMRMPSPSSGLVERLREWTVRR